MLRSQTANLQRVLATTVAVLVASCTDLAVVDPAPQKEPLPVVGQPSAALPNVRISEFHYDNVGTDAGERIEISGPAGTNVGGWRIVKYNGSAPTAAVSYTNSGDPVMPIALGTTIPATCGDRGVLVFTYPVDGLQNGGNDGFALVTAANEVVELLSYEGAFTVAAGQAFAAGMTAVDVLVSEASTTPVGHSISRAGDGTWAAPAANSFGACNDDVGTPPPPDVVATVSVAPLTTTIVAGGSANFTATARTAAGVTIPSATFTWSSSNPLIATVNASGVATGLAAGAVTITATSGTISGTASLTITAAPTAPGVRFAEVHYDNVGTDVNEKIEIEGPAGTLLTGFSVVLYDGTSRTAYSTRALTGSIPATCGARGVVVLDYPESIQNGSPDGMALVNAAGGIVEFLSYEGSFTASGGPADGRSSTDIGVSENGSPYGQSLQRSADGASWAVPATSTFGGCNGTGVFPPQPGSVSFSGRVASDPPLPVGFQDQVFPSFRDAVGNTITGTVVWTSETPLIASVDANGVITSLTAGTAVIRATLGVATGTVSLPMSVAVASATASYIGNTAFGDPTDANPLDDLILRRTEYTTSFSPTRNIPNWVSYNLDATQFGAEDRCDCFTYDPLLPANLPRYTTADYTGATAFHGYGIDRGHLTPSADRTSSSLDNARTYYFTNIIPQAATVNQGPWALQESYLRGLARDQNKEVYIVTGASGSKGTIKDQGVITIPSHVWKVAVIMSRNEGLANVNTSNVPEVIAVVMKNDTDVGGAWEQYRVTIDSVEALSGYDLLSLLPDNIEGQLERGNRFPVAALNGPYSADEGIDIAMSATGSSDPDAGSVLSFAWDFGDGTSSTAISPTKRYAQNGTYTVTLTVSDQFGASRTVTTTATVANVAPTVILSPPASWRVGVAGTLGTRWTDPGIRDAPFTIRINWGDGSPITQFASLTIPTTALVRSKSYAVAGSYTIVVTVTDRDGGVGSTSLTITVVP